MKIIKYQGKDIEVQEIEVLTSQELWNEYQLSDGSVLSVKTVLVKVLKAKDTLNDQGEPLYMVNSQNIVKVKIS